LLLGFCQCARFDAQAGGFKALIFSATAGYRHASITNGIQTIQMLASTNNFTVDATEDATWFNDANLAQYKVIVFLNTTGDVLTNAQQQTALQHYIEAGGGWVGVHAAADTLHNWPWYGGLVGAYFVSHPAIQPATLKVADRVDPSSGMLPRRWVRTDEWYNFDHNPRPTVHVLATVDETTYSGGTQGFDHPIAWSQFYDGGRAWYTESGHTPETYSEPLYQEHLLGGILFAAGVKDADPGSTVDSNYQKVILDSSVADPIELTVAPDGRVFYIERAGNVKIYKPQTSSIVLAGHINVETLIEDGLLGITLDTGFLTNNWLYLFYSPSGTNAEQHISRFTLVGETLDMSSEKILLVIPTQRQECCHSAGSLFMHTNGDLYISAGDNTNPFDSSGFAPLDEQAGRSPWDSQKSASNSNDLRGKILRIHPEADGSYSIPPGNLFPPGTPLTRPEIYIMGCRNPFRMTVDEGTGWLYWGEVGPDAGADSATRGPKGHDEWNQARAAGNFGWPYFVGDNKPYIDYDFATGISGAAFDPNAPVNTSPNNTGLTNLPPAQPAWLWYPYDASLEFPELNGSGGRTAMGGPVYHFNPNVQNRTKLPSYFDQTLFIWEWSRDYIKEVKIDDDGSPLKLNPFLSSFQFNRPIDLKIGPDGMIYVIEWGTGFSGGNADALVERIEYVGGNHPPVAIATATPDNGSVPLTVQFSSAGTYDPDRNDVISIAWSFFGDGSTNSTDPNPVFTYTNAGNYEAQLIVTDSHGNQTVANVPISAGNNKAVVSILQPPNGAIFDWGKTMSYQLSVYDVEDGSTTNGGIACSNVTAAPLLGHNDHSHGQGQFAGCSGVFTAPVNTDSDADNLFLVLNASYTDRGAPNVLPLTSTATYVFPPRHKQAEFCATNATVGLAATSDPNGGGLDIVNITNGSYISLAPVCLTNINAISYRVACNGLGGRIEAHADSPSGPLLGTAFVPFTGGAYTNVTASVSDPGGTHTLYFVFLRNPGDVNLFALNWLEFQGPALSLSPSPYGGTARLLPGTVQAEDFDEGGEGVAYHDLDPINTGGQYRNTGVDIETTLDTGGGYDVTSALAGEWLKYSVKVTAAGLYTLSARVASAAAGGSFHIEFNGIDKTGPIVVPNTSGPQSWQTLSVANVLLDAGPQVMTLVMDTNGAAGYVANFNYLQARLTQGNVPPTVVLTSPADLGVFSAPASFTLAAQANDADGSVAKVDFLASGFPVGTATTSPYQASWSNVGAGNYLLIARATDNIGNSTDSTPRTIRVISGEAPFFGVPTTVPGIIQAEDFDGGGEGVAYHDSDAANNGGAYRATGVDIEATTDTGGGFDVGWTAAGEWIKYTIFAATDGAYTLSARVASSGDGGVFHLEFDGVDKTGPMTNSNSGGWQTWRTLTKTNVGLTAGLHTMRLVMDSNGANGTVGNFNWFSLTGVSTNPPPLLVHRYSFDEPAGATTAADSVSHADGTLLGGASITGTGWLNLPGTGGYVDLPNGLVSVLTNATFEAWLTWNGGGNWQRIFDFGNNSNGENNQGTGLTYIMLTPQSASGVFRFAVTTNSGAGEIGTTWTNALPVGQRIHVAVAYDFTAGTTVLYLNGQRVATGLASIPLAGINDVNVWLGRSNWPDPYFSGQFDEFRVYDGVLSDAGVAASYAAGPNFLPGTRPELSVSVTGSGLQLAWPAGAWDFVLQSADHLGPDAVWTPLNYTPALQNDELTLSLPLTNAPQFFRLQK
jgi:glucose/arabinose dehydrogenase/PKD repeat protein